jgi:methionyl-tRNA formyltransferase
LHPVAQDEVAGDTPLLDAPKFHKADTHLPLDRGVVAVDRTVRAFSPSPSAWTGDPSAPLKVLAGRPEPGVSASPTGTWRSEDGRAWIACSDGWYEVLEVKPTGKRAMAVKDWLNGHPAELAGGSE